MNPVFSEYGLKDLLPLKLDIPDEGCTRPNRSMYCFEAGESFRCKCEHFAKFGLDFDCNFGEIRSWMVKCVVE